MATILAGIVAAFVGSGIAYLLGFEDKTWIVLIVQLAPGGRLRGCRVELQERQAEQGLTRPSPAPAFSSVIAADAGGDHAGGFEPCPTGIRRWNAMITEAPGRA